jgi:hypothetical protein
MRGNVSGEVRQAINLRRVSSMRVSKESSSAASYPSQIATGILRRVSSMRVSKESNSAASYSPQVATVYCVESLAQEVQ